MSSANPILHIDIAVKMIPIYNTGTLPTLSLIIPTKGANKHFVAMSISNIYPFSKLKYILTHSCIFWMDSISLIK